MVVPLVPLVLQHGNVLLQARDLLEQLQVLVLLQSDSKEMIYHPRVPHPISQMNGLAFLSELGNDPVVVNALKLLRDLQDLLRQHHAQVAEPFLHIDREGSFGFIKSVVCRIYLDGTLPMF